MRKTTVVILAIAAALLAALALRESQAARQARHALEVAISERDGLRERVATLEKEQQFLTLENANLRTASSTAAPATAPASARMKPFTERIPRGRIPPPFAALDSPEMRQLMMVEQKGRLDARYAPLFQALRLPPEKLDALKQLLVDKQNALMDVLAAAHRQNLFEAGSGADVPGLVKREQDVIESGIRGLLGDTAYEEYQDFERTRAQRGVVDQLSNRLSYTDAPLSPQQAEALVDLLSAERTTRPLAVDPAASPNLGVRVAMASGSGDTMVAFGPAGMTHETVPITDSSVAAAQSVLNETQLAALQQLQAEQHAQQRMSELMRRSVSTPDGNAAFGTVDVRGPMPDPTTTSARSP